MEAAGKHIDQIGHWHPGLSPHAPYTVHPQLLARAVELSVGMKMPLAMHLAESREEIEWLRDGRGPFRELLESRGAGIRRRGPSEVGPWTSFACSLAPIGHW